MSCPLLVMCRFAAPGMEGVGLWPPDRDPWVDKGFEIEQGEAIRSPENRRTALSNSGGRAPGSRARRGIVTRRLTSPSQRPPRRYSCPRRARPIPAGGRQDGGFHCYQQRRPGLARPLVGITTDHDRSSRLGQRLGDNIVRVAVGRSVLGKSRTARKCGHQPVHEYVNSSKAVAGTAIVLAGASAVTGHSTATVIARNWCLGCPWAC